MLEERRNLQSRAALLRRVIDGIVENPSVTLTVNTLQQWYRWTPPAEFLIASAHQASCAKCRGECGRADPVFEHPPTRLQLAMQKLEQHQKSKPGLHKADDSSPAIVPVSDDHLVGKLLAS